MPLCGLKEKLELSKISRGLTLCGVLAAMTSGCESMSAVSTMFAFSDAPLAQATVKAGATRQDILKLAQPDNTSQIVNGQGTCFDYTMRGNGKVSPYYVAFTTDDKVMSYGWMTCAASDARGNLNVNEAMKQRF